LPSYLTITGFVLLASSFLLAGYFYFIHRLKRQNYLLAWSVAWLLLGAHLVTGAMSTIQRARRGTARFSQRAKS
jgi:hypothetical protein